MDRGQPRIANVLNDQRKSEPRMRWSQLPCHKRIMNSLLDHDDDEWVKNISRKTIKVNNYQNENQNSSFVFNFLFRFDFLIALWSEKM